MANPSSQPTILVKKADGSTVRMTLAEVQALRAGEHKNTPASRIVAQPPHGSGSVAPAGSAGRENTKTPARHASPQGVAGVQKTHPHGVSQTHKHANTQTKPVNPLTREHHKHHPQHHHHNPHPAHVAHLSLREKKRKETGNLKLETAHLPHHQKKSDTRTSESNIWSADDHKSLLEEDRPVPRERAVTTSTPVVKIFQDEAASAAANPKSEIPAHQSPWLQAMAGGRNSKSIADERPLIKNQESGIRNQGLPPQPSRVRSYDLGVRSSASNSSAESMKPVLKDISPPSESVKTMGPVDEIRALTLTDFRRLGPTPVQAGPQLLSKFTSIKEESPFMFLAARQAWPQSPLFRQYIGMVAQALKQRQKLAEAAAVGGAMTMEEIKAIMEVNRQLSV